MLTSLCKKLSHCDLSVGNSVSAALPGPGQHKEYEWWVHLLILRQNRSDNASQLRIHSSVRCAYLLYSKQPSSETAI